jgi:hypothetical protein
MKFSGRKIGALVGLFTVASIMLVSNFAFAQTAGHRPPSGDVYIRDLASPIFGSVFGHVGMSTFAKIAYPGYPPGIYETRIVEVLNKPGAIFSNTFESFFKATIFRGIRYYSSCKTCAHDWQSVITAGLDQSLFDPQYTLYAQYTPGSYKSTTTIVNGKPETKKEIVRARFRCDTFVQYSYKKALNKAFTASPFTPRNLYLKFPFSY